MSEIKSRRFVSKATFMEMVPAFTTVDDVLVFFDYPLTPRYRNNLRDRCVRLGVPVPGEPSPADVHQAPGPEPSGAQEESVVYSPPAPRSLLQDEVDVMGYMVDTLESLEDAAARQRVMSYLAEAYGVRG